MKSEQGLLECLLLEKQPFSEAVCCALHCPGQCGGWTMRREEKQNVEAALHSADFWQGL